MEELLFATHWLIPLPFVGKEDHKRRAHSDAGEKKWRV